MRGCHCAKSKSLQMSISWFGLVVDRIRDFSWTSPERIIVACCLDTMRQLPKDFTREVESRC